MKFAVIRSLVLMKLQIFSINERIRMVSESYAKFSTIVGVEEYFLSYDIQTQESSLCQKKLMFNECLSI